MFGMCPYGESTCVLSLHTKSGVESIMYDFSGASIAGSFSGEREESRSLIRVISSTTNESHPLFWMLPSKESIGEQNISPV